MDSKERHLRTLGQLHDVPSEVIRALAQHADVVEVESGALIAPAGHRATHCLAVVAGTIEDEHLRSMFGLGGLSAQARLRTWPSDVRARTAVTVLAIDRRHVATIVAANQEHAVAHRFNFALRPLAWMRG